LGETHLKFRANLFKGLRGAGRKSDALLLAYATYVGRTHGFDFLIFQEYFWRFGTFFYRKKVPKIAYF